MQARLKHDHLLALATDEPAAQQIDRRGPQKTGDEAGARSFEKIQRCALLLDAAVTEQNNSVGQGHRLDLIVGDVDHRGGDLLVQPLDLAAHLVTQLGIQIRQWLVEQEELRLPHDGPANRHALALTSGELLRQPIEQRGDAQHRRGLADALADFSLDHLARAQAERDVVVDREEGIQRVVLKHHRDVAVAWPQVVDHAATDRDFPAADVLESGDAAQQGALAATRWPDKDDELAIVDLQINALQRLHRSVVLLQILDLDVCHLISL